VEVVERVARLSLTPEIEGGMGSMQEGQTIKALQLTLGQFKGVDSFQLFVEGRQVESLGHLELEPNIPVIR
jgi:spore germination protein GerM